MCSEKKRKEQKSRKEAKDSLDVGAKPNCGKGRGQKMGSQAKNQKNWSFVIPKDNSNNQGWKNFLTQTV